MPARLNQCEIFHLMATQYNLSMSATSALWEYTYRYVSRAEHLAYSSDRNVASHFFHDKHRDLIIKMGTINKQKSYSGCTEDGKDGVKVPLLENDFLSGFL